VPPTVCPDVLGYSVTRDVDMAGSDIAGFVQNPSTACNQDPVCVGYVYVPEGVEDPGLRAAAGTGFTKYFLGRAYPHKGLCFFVKLASSRKFKSDRTHQRTRTDGASERARSRCMCKT
jgi:hypothetical protein